MTWRHILIISWTVWLVLLMWSLLTSFAHYPGKCAPFFSIFGGLNSYAPCSFLAFYITTTIWQHVLPIPVLGYALPFILVFSGLTVLLILMTVITFGVLLFKRHSR